MLGSILDRFADLVTCRDLKSRWAPLVAADDTGAYCYCLAVSSALADIEGSGDLHAGGGDPVGRRATRVLYGKGLRFRHRALREALQQLHG